MATTQAQAEVTERRLRPLYDAIDNGHNKKAVQMADKILKKQDGLHCAKALKGIALLRMGRQEEAAPVMDEVLKACPVDQATLQAATMYYRETGEYKKIVDLYEAATKRYPKNVELLTHLFMSHVRVGDYQKQQQTAATLHKLFPQNGPYYCWRIMSILMQAQESKDKAVVANMYLPLAERLIEKYVEEKKVDGEAEVKLYLMVLERLGKMERKLAVIRGELGEKFRSADERSGAELECLTALERWDEVAELLTKLLRKKPDQWSFIQSYLNCQVQRCLKLRSEGERSEENKKTETEEESLLETQTPKESVADCPMSEDRAEEGSERERHENSPTDNAAGTEAVGERTESSSEPISQAGQPPPSSGGGENTAGDGSGTAGDGSGATGDSSGATGDGSGATGDGSGATGDGSGTAGDGSSATGDGSGATGDGSGTAGDGSGATGDDSGATGDGSCATGDGSGAAGDGSGATGDGSGATGDGSNATVVDSGATGEGNSEEGGQTVEVRAGQAQEESTCEGASAVEPSLRPLLEARDLLEELAHEEQKKAADRSTKTHVYRGPLLARLELLKQFEKHKLHQEVELASPVSLLLDYFHLFRTKSCCFEDLRPYLNFFPEPEINQFLSYIEAEVEGVMVDFDCEDNLVKENVGYLRQRISVLQLQRFCGRHKELTPEEKLSLITHCKHYYRQGLKLGRELPTTVNQHSDFYIILAVHLKIELYQESGEWFHLWDALFMLEYSKRSNPQISLLLMKLYGYMGATEYITDIYDGLFIKHLQTETLGYIPVRYLQAMGTFDFAGQLYRNGLRFYYNCSKEIGEYVIQAYKNGMFQKIVEFVALRERLANSLNFSWLLVDMNLLELCVSVHSLEKAKELFDKEWFAGLPYTSLDLQEYCAKLVDSRDLTVFDDWSLQYSRLSEVETKISFDLECLWLRLRILLIQCLKEAVCLTDPSFAEEFSNPPREKSASNPGVVCNGEEENEAGDEGEGLSGRIKDFSRVMKLMDEHVGMVLLRQRKRHLIPIQAAPPCLGHVFLHEGHGRALREMLIVTEHIALGNCHIEDRLREVLETLQAAVAKLKGVPDELRVALQHLSNPERKPDDQALDLTESPEGHPYTLLTKSKIDLEHYVMFLQVVGQITLLCAVCAELAQPVAKVEPKKKKQKKKKKAPVPTMLKSPVGGELSSFLGDLLVMLLAVAQRFYPLPSVEGDFVERLSRLHITEDPEGPNFEYSVASRMCKNVLGSYNISLRECWEMVQAKANFMKATISRLGIETTPSSTGE